MTTVVVDVTSSRNEVTPIVEPASMLKKAFLAAFMLGAATVGQTFGLELQKGDHICIVGGTVAERMQHYGWLEARLTARFPDHELVFRNLEIGRAHV